MKWCKGKTKCLEIWDKLVTCYHKVNAKDNAKDYAPDNVNDNAKQNAEDDAKELLHFPQMNKVSH